jgi:protein-tyrosine phosphatase
MNWITPQIAIGDYNDAADEDLRRREGIASVLGLVETLGGKSAAELGLLRVEILPLIENAPDQLEVFRNAVDLLGRLVRETPPVLVHCGGGWNRSPGVVAAYLMQTAGLSAEEALARIDAQHTIRLLPETMDLLHAFQRTLQTSPTGLPEP